MDTIKTSEIIGDYHLLNWLREEKKLHVYTIRRTGRWCGIVQILENVGRNGAAKNFVYYDQKERVAFEKALRSALKLAAN